MNDNQQIPEQNKKKLFVGNLPFSLTEDEMRDIFSEFGEIVSVNLITDKFSGRPKGFGFVEYTTEEAAQAAVESLDGKEVNGRNIVVNIAMPPKPRSDRGDRGGFKPRGGRDFNRGNRGGYRNDDR